MNGSVPEVRYLMGEWQKQYLQAVDPVTTLRGIAVTGTNGKTTISRLIAELINVARPKGCAVMGTTGNGILPNLTPLNTYHFRCLVVANALHDYAKQGAGFVDWRPVHMVWSRAV